MAPGYTTPILVQGHMRQAMVGSPLSVASFNRAFARLHLKLWGIGVAFVIISLVLGLRSLYIAPDDESYLAYFEGIKFPTIFDNLWLFLIEEPLWTLYTSWLGSVIGSENSIRFTIIISSLTFLISSTKLTRGAWLFILLIFILDSHLATEMYYNQIRQGIALSVFLFLIVYKIDIRLAAGLAATLHSSFLIVFFAAAVSYIVRTRGMIFFSILYVIAIYYLKTKIGEIELGRRMAVYDIEGKLNVFYYLEALSQYGIVLFLTRPKWYDKYASNWYHFTLLFLALTVPLTFLHEAAGRLMYLASAFTGMSIGMNLHHKKARIGAVIWIFFLILIIVNEGRKLGFNEDTWLGRWILIVS
jgi:EpsG family